MTMTQYKRRFRVGSRGRYYWLHIGLYDDGHAPPMVIVQAIKPTPPPRKRKKRK
jgi:hypothetical protein